MLDHPAIDQLKALKLDGMAEAFVELANQDASGDMSHAEWLGLLIDREAASSLDNLDYYEWIQDKMVDAP